MNTVLINLFIFGCKFINKTYDFCKKIYTTNSYVRHAVWYSKTAYCYLTFQHSEPYMSPWISKSWLTPNPTSITNKFFFHEIYKSNFNEVFFYLFNNTSITFFDAMNLFLKPFCSNNIDSTSLFVMKLLNEENEDCYIVSKNQYKFPSIIKKSKAKFLTIEYNHPEMDNPIDIVLDRAWFYSGNELFSQTFVLRLLSYQYKHFIFDNHYTISMIDNKMNFITFGNNKHILLTDTGYEIVENNVVRDIDNIESESESDNDNDNDGDSDNDSDSNTKYKDNIKDYYEICGELLNDIS